MELPKQIGRMEKSIQIGTKTFSNIIRPQATAEYLSDTSPKS